MDRDFVGFSYGTTHFYRDLKIYRTSDGSRYNTNLIPTLTDKTADIPGGDGQYFFDSYHKNRQINVNFAFDSLTELDLRRLRQVLNGKEIQDLIFDEAPYKAYSAKVTGTPQIKALCFDEDDGNGGLHRVYKGDGSITFTCYNPYAHTPNWLWDTNDGVTFTIKEADGRLISNYSDLAYHNKDQWNSAAGLTDSTGINLGEVAAPFVVTGASSKVTVSGNTIHIVEGTGTWNSAAGLVTDSNGVAIKYTGNGCATIPVGAEATTTSGTLDYEYWYY